MGIGRVWDVAEEKKEGEGEGEEGNELGMRRGHSVALAMHFCGRAGQHMVSRSVKRIALRARTPRPLLFDISLEDPIEGLARHLAGEHEDDLDLAVGPYQGRVDDA